MAKPPKSALTPEERELAMRLEESFLNRRDLIARHPTQKARPISSGTAHRRLVNLGIAEQESRPYSQTWLRRGPNWCKFVQSPKGRQLRDSEFTKSVELAAWQHTLLDKIRKQTQDAGTAGKLVGSTAFKNLKAAGRVKPAITSFVALAREDIVVAKKILTQHRRHAAFLIEQAAEKLLKAILTAEGITFTATHDQLDGLAQLLPVNHIWRADVMAFDALTSYATALRYPTPGGRIPEAPEAAALKVKWQRISDLTGEIEDWCQERAED